MNSDPKLAQTIVGITVLGTTVLGTTALFLANCCRAISQDVKQHTADGQ